MERLTTPFDARSTAAEVVAGVDLDGRRIVVTGGASGIGLETARVLAGAGAEVTIAVRDVVAGQRAADGSPCSWPRSTWPTGRPWPRSWRAGRGRCTSWSPTRA